MRTFKDLKVGDVLYKYYTKYNGGHEVMPIKIESIDYNIATNVHNITARWLEIPENTERLYIRNINAVKCWMPYSVVYTDKDALINHLIKHINGYKNYLTNIIILSERVKHIGRINNEINLIRKINFI